VKPNRPDHLSLLNRLLSLNNIPERNPERMDTGRKQFLNQAIRLRNEKRSLFTNARVGRSNQSQSVFPPLKPRFATALIASLFIFFVLAGSGISLVAAQNSQPGSPIYAAKILREDIQLAFEPNAADRTRLSLQFSQTRADELELLFMEQKTPSEKVLSRYENQVTRTIYNALQQQDDKAVNALFEVWSELRLTDQKMETLSQSASPEILPAINRIRIMLMEQIQLAAQGMENPSQIRSMVEWRYQHRNRELGGYATLTGTGTASNTNTHQPQSTQTPHQNPTWNATRTPMGPGPNPSASPENTPQGPGPNPTAGKTKTPQGPGATPTQKGSNTPHGPGPQGTNAP
jgi:hypothetical protein